MSELTARRDHWTDMLPGNWQQAINTSPVLNALGRALNRPAPDLTRGIEYDQYGSVSDRNWLLEQAAGGPPKLNPLAAEMLDKGGLLANFLGPGVKLPAAAPKPTGIRAYHGSPHDFDKFDISKIGTGEGAQAYGRGLYFAESEGVAKSYRDALGGKGSVSPYAQSMLSVSGSNIDAALSAIKARLRRPGGFPLAKDEERQALIALSELTDMKLNGALTGPGRMYEVRINADPEQFLDWDKPLAQQPEAVRRLAQGMPETATGEQIYRSIAERPRQGQRSGDPLNDVLFDIPVTDHADAARRLREAGVPGTRYLDQGSRAVGSGTRNYAVWDDKLIEILRKYGLLPPIAAGTAAALNQQEPPL